VLLIHGTEDTRVPLQSMTDAETTLRAVGIAVETLGRDRALDRRGRVGARRPLPASGVRRAGAVTACACGDNQWRATAMNNDKAALGLLRYSPT
jgi:hypothetical protein